MRFTNIYNQQLYQQENQIIDVIDLTKLPMDKIVNLYKQGYKLSEKSNNEIIYLTPKIQSLQSTKICNITSKTPNDYLTMSITPSGAPSGTPYRLTMWRDNINTVIQQIVTNAVPPANSGEWNGTTWTHSFPPNTNGVITTADVGTTHTFGAWVQYTCSDGTIKTSDYVSCPISVVAGTVTPPPPSGAGYSCVNGVCSYVSSGAQYATLADCQTVCTAGGGGGGLFTCTPSCVLPQKCYFGTCIDPKYITYGVIGFGALFLLSLLK